MQLLRMYHDENTPTRQGCGGPVLLVCLLIALLLSGCKTQYVEVPVVHTEYVSRIDTFIQKDSVFRHDSVFIHSKGDTVWYEKWHTQYVDRWRDRVIIKDSLVVDSVAQPYPVPADNTYWEKTKIRYGGWAMGILAGCIIIFVMRLKKKILF